MTTAKTAKKNSKIKQPLSKSSIDSSPQIKKSRQNQKQKKNLYNTNEKLRLQDPFLSCEQLRYKQPLPSRAFILKLLTQADIPVAVKDLVNTLEIMPEEETAFMRRLQAMAREGEIIINRKGALCLPEKVRLIKGYIQGHPDGFGFVIADQGPPDLFLSPKEMHKVLHGDRVLARIIDNEGSQRMRTEAKIVEVLEHVNKELVGRLYSDQGAFYVVAENQRISQEILIPAKEVGPAQAGQVVMVEILTQPNKYAQPVGRIIDVLGNHTDPGMEIEIALRKYQLPFLFSQEIQSVAEKMPTVVRPQDWKTATGKLREDIRHLPLVTIDGEKARDFDDAVYAEPYDNGWRLVVAIADVSHYVQEGSALDECAKERGTSVYFPRRVIPMLPEQLSNGICSLNPHVERLCLVCDMHISASGNIDQYRFYPAVMCSAGRLTYEQVWQVLQLDKTAEQISPLLPQLKNLYQLYQCLLAERKKRGAIDFDTVETDLVFNNEGKIDKILPIFRNPAHRLIEECMLAANVSAAQFLLTKQHAALFRIHDRPSEEKLNSLRQVLQEFGLSLGGGDKPCAKDYANLMKKITHRADQPLLQTLLLRSMQQATYSAENIGHFGLGYSAYTHFTSPIRRYPDLLAHRAIKAVLSAMPYEPNANWSTLGTHCSMTERRADEAAREVTNWLKCFYMQDKVGEVFEGVVSAVTSFGIFVSLKDLYVEGLVHISELGNDYFEYDATRHLLIGNHSNQIYRLNDTLRIKVVRVDLDTSRLDFVLA